MRIAMLSEHASPLAALGGVDAGGQNVHVAALAGALAGQGHDVTVFTRRDSARLPGRVELPGAFAVEHLDAGPAAPIAKDDIVAFVPDLAEALTARLLAAPPDVLHAHFWMSGVACLDTGAALGVPVVQTFHALGAVKRRFQGAADTSPVNRIRHEKRIAREASRVIASSADERSELLRMGADPGRIDVVPSGVDLTLFGPEGPRAPRSGPSARLLCVSRLVPRKGVDDAIRVVAQVPGAELVVAGGPPAGAFDADPEVRRLRALADELGVTARVRFLGSVEHRELAPLIRSADVLLCLPWYEPFGIVPLEAMACGVPVVATAVGGLLDTVVAGRTGVHVAPRDPQDAAAAVRALLAEPATRRRMGERGVRRAASYAWDSVAARVSETYAAATCPSGLRVAGHDREVAG